MAGGWWLWSAGSAPPRLRRTVFLACAVCAGAFVAGCGNASLRPPAVQISLTAPTDGATVGVQRVLVFGTVVPAWSTVRVAGVRVHVTNGAFRRWIHIPRGISHIRVLGAARGYLPEHLGIAVRSAVFHTTVFTRPGPRWAARADHACAKLGSQITALPALTPANYFQDFDTIQSAEARTMIELKAIHPPQRRAAAYAAFVAGLELQVSQSNQILADLRSRQIAAAIKLAAAMATAQARSDEQATALGLPSCAEEALPAGG